METPVTDSRVAQLILSAIVALLAGLALLFLLIWPTLNAEEAGTIDSCLAAPTMQECRECCVAMGGGKAACSRTCAHREGEASPAGLPRP